MACVSWVLAVAVACVSSTVGGQCWESARCKDLSSEDRIQECIHCCRSESLESSFPEHQSTEESLTLGILLTTLATEPTTEVDPKPEAHDIERRSYSMEHFRWGKPGGRKRRPIKVFPLAPEEGDSFEGSSFRPRGRRQLASLEDGGGGPQASVGAGSIPSAQKGLHKKKGGIYRMGHFRWGSLLLSKRSVTPWTKQSHKPLLTLLRNVIGQDRQ